MSHIKTFGRFKPAPELYDEYDIKSKKVFCLRVPELLRDYGAIPSSKNRSSSISYDFRFDGVFDTKATQEEVFSVAAKEIVGGFVDGYNGTIFAYGQTGTGKTYTMEGSALRYSDRGMAPRALAEIYKCLEQREDEDISLHISYLEIYQEIAYDLLSTSARSSSPVTVFPRVTVQEGSNGTCSIRNLSLHLAPSEAAASSLLLQGQANRKVAETPVNQRSSRSHAVFTIYLTAKKTGSDIIRRSKLHLVDLAGSERVAKTGVDGQQLTEAKSINLSLHHLETVIIALQADSTANRPRSTGGGTSKANGWVGGRPSSVEGVRRHVPYRNSLLTMVLRDSLGGNCLTSMVATFSLEVHNLGETLSTCRFAQRVACIANHARRNEEIDDKTLIQQLKRRVAELEAQMACLRMSQGADDGEMVEEESSSKLTDEEKLSCAQVVQEYLSGRVADPVTAGITNPYKFRECLRILKRMVMNKYFQDKLPGQASRGNQPQLSNGSMSTNQTTAGFEEQRNADTLRLDTAPAAGGQSDPSSSNDANSRSTGANGEGVDTDELILSIQRLYAASRREQRTQQGTPPPLPETNTPPRSAASSSYKSPFERKREKEIRKLSRKVDEMKKVTTSQESHLQTMRVSTAFGELSSSESIIRNKIQVTRDQIADQHAYRLHLRHTEAAPDILTQEKMVEDMLIKREAKFQKKLDDVLREKKDMEAEAMQADGCQVKDSEEGQGQRKLGASEKRSLEEQFAQYRKRNGTLNTRQVFDMLKSEEKKQTKVSQQGETEKKFLMTKQLAQKEEATREKLRDLKEMLRKSRQATVMGLGLGLGPGPMPAHPHPHPHPSSGPSSAFGFYTAQHVGSFPSSSQQTPFSMNGGGGGGGGGSSSHHHHHHTEVMDLEEEEEGGGGESLDQMFVVGGEQPKNSADDLEASMTRGDDSSGGERRVQGERGGGVGVTMRGGGGGSKTRSTGGGGGDAWPGQVQGQGQPLASRGGGGAGTDQMWESAYSRPSTSNTVRSQSSIPHPSRHQRDPSSSHGGHLSVPSPAAEERGSGRVSGGSNTSDLTHSSSDSPVPRLSLQQQQQQQQQRDSNNNGRRNASDTDENTRNNKGDHHHHHHNHGQQEDRREESYSPTVMPSEYVGGMEGRGGKFDARKMGLSSKTFDTALTSMLNDDQRQQHQHSVTRGYDQYARAAVKPPVKKAAYRASERRAPSSSSTAYHSHAAHQSHHHHRSPERRPAVSAADVDHTGKFASSWGPEAKNSSVAKRLAQFLSDDAESRASRSPRPDSKEKNKGVSFLERLSQLQAQERPEDMMGSGVTSPRIKSTPDPQRETTYMGRVQAERQRVAKIREARAAAETIQRAWRRHCRSNT